MAYELRLEQLTSEMEYGTVTRWLKREGDSVVRGDPLIEVEAEKANHEIEAPVTATIESILVAEGDEVRVGTTLAILSER